MLARLLLWRLLGLAAFLVGLAVLAWLLHGGLGATLRGASAVRTALVPHTPRTLRGLPVAALAEPPAALVLALAALLLGKRRQARRRRCYVRMRVEVYRTDRTSVEGIVAMFEALHKRLQHRWWRRLLRGQPSVALEVHHIRDRGGAARAQLALACPHGLEMMVEAALRSAYPNCRLASPGEALPLWPVAGAYVPARPSAVGPPDRRVGGSSNYVPRAGGSANRAPHAVGRRAALLRLKKQAGFIKRVKQLDRYELVREPPVDRLITVMGACEEDAVVQLALTPAPALLERYAKWRYKHHEDRLSRERREHLFMRDRSLVEDAELRGGLEVQHRPLYFVDLRVLAPARGVCEQIASELRAEGAENRLVERGTAIRHGLLGLYDRRLERGEGNPWPSLRKGVLASTELAALWHLPSIDYTTVPFARGALPQAPAAPAIMRPREGPGLLRDALGPVSIHPNMRRQNTAVPGAVEQGKSSYLTATVAEDLRRERCAVIVLDPKGDAAEAAVSLVPRERTCTLLDFAHPTCGFNPLAVQAPADVIADYVVAALRNLFTDADIRASSDRYLRNAIIAVLAHDRRSTLWDAARLLSVGEEGYAYRARVGAHVRTLPEFKEIAEFFTAELTAQLADSRSTTTAKLDAPVNKLARLLNSPSIKRVLLNDSLTVDFDRVISHCEVLVVKGALGAMGAGNTSVLMQLLMGMLDAALARRQDAVAADRSGGTLAFGEHPPFGRRVAVALKVDEAPLVLNRGFAETLALKRSAGLETVACWQTDAQWTDREVRAQLDALFAHRVYFATASVSDARDAASLMMAEFSDTVRPDITGLSALGHPDARLHLPKHHAIASWVTPEGRQAPFLASTIPLRVDRERLALHAARQAARGGLYLADLSQPHWDRSRETLGSSHPRFDRSRQTLAGSHPRSGQQEGAAASDAGEGERHDVDPGPRRGEDGRESFGIVHAGECEGETRGRGASMPRDEGERGAADHPNRLPETAAETYAELVDLDAAHSVRWARPVGSSRALDPDPLDLEILALVVSMRHVLSSQIHRRFNPRRAATTTQRRLKRLSDAGLVERFQFHRRDGGGAPMCYVIAPHGLALLRDNGRLDPLAHGGVDEARTPSSKSSNQTVPFSTSAGSSPLPLGRDRQLRQARHDVHVTGWALALEGLLGAAKLRLRGPEQSVLSPPLRSSAATDRRSASVAIGPGDLRLPGGRAPHDFLRTDPSGARVEVERFETVRPHASIEVPASRLPAVIDPRGGVDVVAQSSANGAGASGGFGAGGVCLLVELDDRLCTHSHRSAAAKLERYDHLLAGWSVCAPRFADRSPLAGSGRSEVGQSRETLASGRGREMLASDRSRETRQHPRFGQRPVVVFLCRNRHRARECARRADHLLSACRAYAGEYPRDWEYPGRAAIVFASERDVHEGLLLAYGVPSLPPEVRVAAHGNIHAREAACEQRELLPGCARG
jgi:hypothetical protein